MPDLLLHIGHVKTASTWLQEGFDHNEAALAAAGIRYPRPSGSIDPNAQVPAGNGLGLFDDPGRAASRIARAAQPDRITTLFSSEMLFARLAQQQDLHFVPKAARDAGFGRVRMLMFVRSPLPLAASIWQQRVKGNRGETRDLDTFAARSFDMPRRVATFVDRLDGIADVELTLHNYDVHRRDPLTIVERWLGIGEHSLVRPGRTSLNRSLTRAEAALQLALNREIGPSGDIFAIRLGNCLGDIPSDPPRISENIARELLDRHADALDRIDALLPEGEALSRAIPPAAEGPLTFSEAQMAVIAEGLATRLRPGLRTRLARAARTLLSRRG